MYLPEGGYFGVRDENASVTTISVLGGNTLMPVLFFLDFWLEVCAYLSFFRFGKYH